MIRSVLLVLLTAALGLGAAGLAACGDDNELIFDAPEAQDLEARLDAIQSAVEDQDCERLAGQAEAARSRINALGADVDRDVRIALSNRFADLGRKAIEECDEAVSSARAETDTPEEETPTETEQETETETTETETTETETETTPETTPTTPPETEPETTPIVPEPPPPPAGGVTAPEAGE